MSTKIMVKDFISNRLAAAATQMAQYATTIEETSNPRMPVSSIPVRDPAVVRVMEFSASAVVMSVAALEGFLNEIFSEAADELSGNFPHASRTPEELAIKKRWARMWKREIPGRGFSAAEKVQILLELADIEPLSKGVGSMQHLTALIRLRNALVHSEPSFQPHMPFGPKVERGDMERLLAGKFEQSKILAETVPFLWARCLCAGCARWAVETRVAVENDVRKALGISIEASAPWRK